MKMIFLGLVMFAATAAGAQTDKGDLMVGGNAGFRTNKGYSDITLSPNVGYFFGNNFAAGANLNLSFNKTGDVKTTTLGLGPFARYYIGHRNFTPFAVVETNYLLSNTKDATTKLNSSGVGFLAGIGGAAFINQSVAFETIAGYNHSSLSGTVSNGFSLRFGFQVYLTRNRVEALRGRQFNRQ